MNRRKMVFTMAFALAAAPGIALGASKAEKQAEVRKAAQGALAAVYGGGGKLERRLRRSRRDGRIQAGPSSSSRLGVAWRTSERRRRPATKVPRSGRAQPGSGQVAKGLALLAKGTDKVRELAGGKGALGGARPVEPERGIRYATDRSGFG